VNPAPQRHYVALDAFRFIAALGIVLHHCAIYADAMGWQSHVTMFDNFRLCVDFFFALSGFVLMHVHGSAITSGSDYLRFLQKRLARISPLHALMVIVFIMLALAVAGRPMATRIAPVLDPATALPNLMLLHSFGVTQTLSLDFPSWSISAEWFLYLLFPTLAAFVLRIGPRGAIFAAIAFAMALALTRDAFDLRDWTRSTFDFGMLRALPSFLAGIAVCVMVERAPPCAFHGRGFMRELVSSRSCFRPHPLPFDCHFSSLHRARRSGRTWRRADALDASAFS